MHRLLSLMVCLSAASAINCGAPAVPVDESTEAYEKTDTIYYEGSCSFLKCALCNDATGACGLGCTDSEPRIVVPDLPTKMALGCGTKLRVCHLNNCAVATVWDLSDPKHKLWEGNTALMNALKLPIHDGTCNAQQTCPRAFVN